MHDNTHSDSRPRHMSLGIAGAVLVTAFATPPGSAVAAESARPIEEIFVTARRREESQQDVPAVISVFTEESMFTSGNDSMEHLRDVIPNFNPPVAFPERLHGAIARESQRGKHPEYVSRSATGREV